MDWQTLEQASQHYLQVLCEHIQERSVGSVGNQLATGFWLQEMMSLGWDTELATFPAMDWRSQGAQLHIKDQSFEMLSSPYSLGCKVSGELIAVQSINELQKLSANGKIILLHGELAKEQLMPKNFVFYNPEHHQQIISLLESSGAQALICATSRNAGLAGGVYPFPLIEDGDFDIPSVYTTEEMGTQLLQYAGQQVQLISSAQRISSRGHNGMARKAGNASEKIVVTAHIDAKQGTPGAIDNATGVIVLLLLGKLLQDYTNQKEIELVAFNGEDYYAVSGQMQYIAQNQQQFDNVVLNINIDGAGFHQGPSALSCYQLPQPIDAIAQQVIAGYDDIVLGVPWVQGDHSIFVQFGRPAIAFSSQWFVEHVDSQDITHTPKDNPSIVSVQKLPIIAAAIADIIRQIDRS